MDYLKIDECEDRAVYRIKSRNLGLGVWDSKAQGFVGIRTKFGSEFLFMEYHYDTGAPYGTAYPLEKLTIVPEVMPLYEYEPYSVDKDGRRVRFSEVPKVGGGGKKDGLEVEGWIYEDGTPLDLKENSPYAVMNKVLFDFLKGLEVTG